MHNRTREIIFGLCWAWVASFPSFALAQTQHSDPYIEELAQLSLPENFTIRVLVAGVKNARQIAQTPAGHLIVGTRGEGKVYAVLAAPTPGSSHTALGAMQPMVITLANDLTMPSGTAMIGKDLYVAALNQVLQYPDIDQQIARALTQAPVSPAQQKHSKSGIAKPINRSSEFKARVVTDTLPDKRHHGWKYLSVGPDQQLYVPIGAPCNICLSDDPRFATIMQLNPTTGVSSVYAAGIRNSVGQAWHPGTGQLWFSENGRDRLGDDIPAEEINVVTDKGQHFGYPFVHAGEVLDPEFGTNQRPETFQPPRLNIQAHSALLGIAFYTNDQVPKPYRNSLIVAEHGSWNRNKKVGYQVGMVRFNENGKSVYQPFITGWLQNESSWGRPNDVFVATNGELLISDDQLGVIYAVTHHQ